jgi:hypothetical protein
MKIARAILVMFFTCAALMYAQCESSEGSFSLHQKNIRPALVDEPSTPNDIAVVGVNTPLESMPCEVSGCPSPLLPELNVDDFAGLPATMLDELRVRWHGEIRLRAVAAGYPIDLDPVLSPTNPADLDALLLRYLRAERHAYPPRQSLSPAQCARVVANAVQRLNSTVDYRIEYDIVAFYRRGAARDLIFHDRNPGACLYFADRGVVDREGRTVLIGRFGLLNQAMDLYEVANHLRAGMFVVERALGAMRLPQRKVGSVLIFKLLMIV